MPVITTAYYASPPRVLHYAPQAARLAAVTMAATASDDDPFRDPLRELAALPPPSPDTLAVGRNASLTLGTDSLIVLGRQSRTGCKRIHAHT